MSYYFKINENQSLYQSFSLSPFSAASFGRSPASGWWAGQPPRCLRPSGWGSGKSPGCKNPETSQEAGSASFGTHRPVIKLNKCNFLDDIFYPLKSCSFFIWVVLTLQLHETIKSVRFCAKLPLILNLTETYCSSQWL